MRRNSSRLLAGVLCLALALTACGSSGGSGKLPSGTKTPEEQTRPSAQEGQTARYDDSLITEVVSLDTSFQNEYGETCLVSIHLPQLTSGGARALNRKIMDRWGGLAEKTTEDFARECLAVTVQWESHWSGGLLSLVMTEEQPGIGPDYAVFHYDFAQERELTAGELLDRLDIPEDTLRAALCRTAADSFDAIFSRGQAAAPEELALLRAKTLAAAADAVRDLSFYSDQDGSLTAYLDICTPVGAGWSVWEEIVPLDPNAVPLRAESDGVAAAVKADGTVEVWLEKSAANEAYQDEYGFQWGKRYPIGGCYGDYKKLCVGSVGPGYAPCLFLLTDIGTVEYVRLFDGFRFGTLVSHGPLYGVGVSEGLFSGDRPQVVDLEAGTGEHISTVFAVMSDGSRCDLAEMVNTGGTLRPFDLSGQWEASVTGTDGAVTEYDIEIQPTVSATALTVTERIPGEGISVPYTGCLDYLGMNETGMVYGYTVTGPDGNDLVGSVALLPQWETMLAAPVGGDPLFESPDRLQFTRVEN